jgi:hypothetical protein
MKLVNRNKQVCDFEESVQGILKWLRSAEPLSAEQEKVLVDAINALQNGYNQWLERQPVKEQTFTDSSPC